MALKTPLFLNIDGTYGAADLGLPYKDVVSEGVVGAGDLAVTQRAAGANMSVDIAAGKAWVQGDDDPELQPIYRAFNDATVNIALSAADASNPRVDRVVLRIHDSVFAGSTDGAAFEVIEGAPTAGADLTNLNGAADVPNTALLLANVLVPGGASSITDADISDQRTTSQTGSGAAKAAPSSIPGEMKLYSGSTLPDPEKYGTWVWADGGTFDATEFPEAAANIDTAWDTHNGKAAPGGTLRRVPDMRGAVPVGPDNMGGSAAGRTTRATAVAGALGAEYHALSATEMPSHSHGVNDPTHYHQVTQSGVSGPAGGGGVASGTGVATTSEYTGISIQSSGGGGAHENVQPSNVVPYIVFLG